MSGSKSANITKPPPSPSQPEESQRLTSIVRCARPWERRSGHLTSAGRSAQSPSKGGGGRKLSTSVSKKKSERSANPISSESGFTSFYQLLTSGNLKKSDRREHDLVRVRVYGFLLVTYAWEPKKRVTEGNTISSESGFTSFYQLLTCVRLSS